MLRPVRREQQCFGTGSDVGIIRTLDIGADKQVDYFGLDKEDNPALGYRAIRICLTRPEIFKTQLRALYRAAMFGNISIMFPMIISVNEVLRIKEIIAEVKEELKNEGIPYKEVESVPVLFLPFEIRFSGWERKQLGDRYCVRTVE